MNDFSDEEAESPESAQSPLDSQSSQSSVLFGSNLLSAKKPRLLHPPPAHLSALFYFYSENVDPMFKLLHIPSLRKLIMHASANHEDIPSGNYVEAMLFAMYYAAITSLTSEECLRNFYDSRDSLLARYKSGVESALTNADLLNTKEIGTLQALVMFLVSICSLSFHNLAQAFIATSVLSWATVELFHSESCARQYGMLRGFCRRAFVAMTILNSHGHLQVLLYALVTLCLCIGKHHGLAYLHLPGSYVVDCGGS